MAQIGQWPLWLWFAVLTTAVAFIHGAALVTLAALDAHTTTVVAALLGLLLMQTAIYVSRLLIRLWMGGIT